MLALLFLIGIGLPSLWSPPFPLHAPALIPLSRHSVALAHLDSLPPCNLVVYTDGSVPFLFDKGGSGVLVNCSLCDTEAILSFSAGPVCSNFFAEACAGLSSTNKSATSLLFSSYLILARSFPPYPLLHLSLYSISLADLAETVFSLSRSIRLQWVPVHSFLPGNDTANELAGRAVILTLSVILCSLSPLTSPIHSFLGLEAYCLI